MSATSPLLDLLRFGGPRLPLLIIYLVGIILALTTWSRHPTASLLSLLAFVLLILGSLLSVAVSWYFGTPVSGYGTALSERLLWMQVGNYISVGMQVIAWVLLLVALFARRPQAPELWARPPSSGRGGLDLAEGGAPPGPTSQDIRR